jgi:hypothetical protein
MKTKPNSPRKAPTKANHVPAHALRSRRDIDRYLRRLNLPPTNKPGKPEPEHCTNISIHAQRPGLEATGKRPAWHLYESTDRATVVESIQHTLLFPSTTLPNPKTKDQLLKRKNMNRKLDHPERHERHARVSEKAYQSTLKPITFNT